MKIKECWAYNYHGSTDVNTIIGHIWNGKLETNSHPSPIDSFVKGFHQVINDTCSPSTNESMREGCGFVSATMYKDGCSPDIGRSFYGVIHFTLLPPALRMRYLFFTLSRKQIRNLHPSIHSWEASKSSTTYAPRLARMNQWAKAAGLHPRKRISFELRRGVIISSRKKD